MACLGKAANIHQYNEVLKLCYTSDEMQSVMFGTNLITPPPFAAAAAAAAAAPTASPAAVESTLSSAKVVKVLPMSVARVTPNSLSYGLLIDALLLEGQPEKAESALQQYCNPPSPQHQLHHGNEKQPARPKKSLEWAERRVAAYHAGSSSGSSSKHTHEWEAKRLAIVVNWLVHAAHPVAKAHPAAESGALSLVWQLHKVGEASTDLYSAVIDYLGVQASKHHEQYKLRKRKRRKAESAQSSEKALASAIVLHRAAAATAAGAGGGGGAGGGADVDAAATAAVPHQQHAASLSCEGRGRDGASECDVAVEPTHTVSMSGLPPGCAVPRIASLLLELRENSSSASLRIVADITADGSTIPTLEALGFYLMELDPPLIMQEQVTTVLEHDYRSRAAAYSDIAEIEVEAAAATQLDTMEAEDADDAEDAERCVVLADSDHDPDVLEHVTFVLDTDALQQWYRGQQADSLATAVCAEETARSCTRM